MISGLVYRRSIKTAVICSRILRANVAAKAAKEALLR